MDPEEIARRVRPEARPDIRRAVGAAREPVKPKAKRVYHTVAAVAAGEGFRIHLDGKPAMTPGRRPLAVGARALAAAVAAEWDAQNSEIDPEAMPLTRLVATQLDQVAPQRDVIVTELLKYADTDVLCYRAPERELKARQAAAWQPVLDWLAATHGVEFTSVEGVLPMRQPAAAATKLKAVLDGLDDMALTAYQACAALTSSLSLPLALVHGRLNAGQVHAAAHLDEIYQAEKWGEDAEAKERRARIADDIEAIERYLTLSRS